MMCNDLQLATNNDKLDGGGAVGNLGNWMGGGAGRPPPLLVLDSFMQRCSGGRRNFSSLIIPCRIQKPLWGKQKKKLKKW